MDLEPRIRAPDVPVDAIWLNSDRPLRLDGELRGKVVLLDFWTYCCINCMHVLPELRTLERKYAGPLVIIGVHSAKFTNEKEAESVRQAVLRYGIEHPVVCDPEHLLWSHYAVSAWPTLVVIDPVGYVVGQISGEGHHDTLDQVIGDLIEGHRDRGSLDERPLHLPLERDRVTVGPLSFPGKVLADPASGRLFIADSGNHRIVVCDLDGQVQAVIGSGEPGADDGSFARARFRNPQGMSLFHDLLYVADTDNHLVRRVSLAEARVDTLFGTGAQARIPNQPGRGREVALNSPWDLVAIATPGTGEEERVFLFIAMAGSHQIWLANLDELSCYPFAGSAAEGLLDGARSEACLAQPSGIAHHRRWLFVADSEVSAVRCIDLESEQVSTLIGHGLFTFGDRDGPWEEALLQHPLGVAVAGATVYIADSYNHKIKAIDLTASQVRTIAGDGSPGHDDGRPGRLNEPASVSVTEERVFVADTNNHAVRVIDRTTREISTLRLTGLDPSAGQVDASPVSCSRIQG